jgi:hypothetical protein
VIPVPPVAQTEAGVLRLVCSWCQRVMREGDAPTPVSSGICHACYQRVLDEETR